MRVSLTSEILEIIGSPFARVSPNPNAKDLLKLYHYASLNRIRLLFSEALVKGAQLGPLKAELHSLKERFEMTLEAFSRASVALADTGVNYAFFKSIRPYPEVTVDLDIIVFGNDYRKAILAFLKKDYRLLGFGPLSTTVQDIVTGINVDIYDEIGTSKIVYLDKDQLEDFVVYRTLAKGIFVRSLSPGADLLALMAHSIVKEQMYVLSEYYTTLNYLLEMKETELKGFLTLVKACRLRTAVAAHFSITALLHLSMHEFIPDKLKRLINEVGLNADEMIRVARNELLMPHKYHSFTVINALIEKLGEHKARRSIAFQAMSMFKPSFMMGFVKELLYHITRETY